MLEDNSQWIFCISAYQVARDTDSLFLDCLFKDVCIRNSLLRQRECLSPEQKAGVLKFNKDNVFPLGKAWASLLTSHYKSLVFPKLRFLSCDAIRNIFSIHLDPPDLPPLDFWCMKNNVNMKLIVFALI